MHIANNRDDKYNFCNNPDNKVQRYCCEWYLYNLRNKNDS